MGSFPITVTKAQYRVWHTTDFNYETELKSLSICIDHLQWTIATDTINYLDNIVLEGTWNRVQFSAVFIIFY